MNGVCIIHRNGSDWGKKRQFRRRDERETTSNAMIFRVGRRKCVLWRDVDEEEEKDENRECITRSGRVSSVDAGRTGGEFRGITKLYRYSCIICMPVRCMCYFPCICVCSCSCYPRHRQAETPALPALSSALCMSHRHAIHFH